MSCVLLSMSCVLPSMSCILLSITSSSTRPPYYNNKPKREGKDPANMSNYETNPVGALQVRSSPTTPP